MYTEEALQEAVDAVKNGLGQRLAAKEFGVPKYMYYKVTKFGGEDLLQLTFSRNLLWAMVWPKAGANSHLTLLWAGVWPTGGTGAANNRTGQAHS